MGWEVGMVVMEGVGVWEWLEKVSDYRSGRRSIKDRAMH